MNTPTIQIGVSRRSGLHGQWTAGIISVHLLLFSFPALGQSDTEPRPIAITHQFALDTKLTASGTRLPKGAWAVDLPSGGPAALIPDPRGGWLLVPLEAEPTDHWWWNGLLVLRTREQDGTAHTSWGSEHLVVLRPEPWRQILKVCVRFWETGRVAHEPCDVSRSFSLQKEALVVTEGRSRCGPGIVEGSCPAGDCPVTSTGLKPAVRRTEKSEPCPAVCLEHLVSPKEVPLGRLLTNP